MSYQNDLNRFGSTGGSACFCSGVCRQLGYCPNQNSRYSGYLPPPHDGKGYVLRSGITESFVLVPKPAREMTAADLGLVYVGPPFGHRLSANYHCYIGPAACVSDAPYSFWLGADR